MKSREGDMGNEGLGGIELVFSYLYGWLDMG